MGAKQTKVEIQHLKEQLRSANKANDTRLLKLTLVLVIVAVIAGIWYGKIQLW